ncbi:MAG: PAS domain-containing protein, partial [Pseudorhodoplanes sp.]
MVKKTTGRKAVGQGAEKAARPGQIKVKSNSKTSAAARLQRETALHARTRARLERAEELARQRSEECEELKARFEIALRGAAIHAFAQDRDLRYTWITGPYGDEAALRMLGRTDDELWSSPEQQAVIAVKRRVLATGIPEDCEVSCIMPERRALFALHIEPVLAPSGEADGIMCTAVDVSRIRSLESEQRRLTEDLATAVQRYEFALRGSNVAVFTQDTDLRYTSVSKPLFGLEPGALYGRTDSELLAGARAGAIVALKNEVLQQGEPRDAELRIETGAAARWYDFHIEPMCDIRGGLIGLTGAAVDITERKEGEAHLRLLMRELTHRSKNLLAVIQAMARQTAR